MSDNKISQSELIIVDFSVIRYFSTRGNLKKKDSMEKDTEGEEEGEEGTYVGNVF